MPPPVARNTIKTFNSVPVSRTTEAAMRRVVNSTYTWVDGVVQAPRRWTFGYDSGVIILHHQPI
jgi:hypothetical protein